MADAAPGGSTGTSTVETHWRDALVILLAQGSEATASGAEQARRHAETIGGMGLFAEVKAAFLRDTPHPREVIADSPRRDIYIIPFMTADGYSIDTLIPEALGLAGELTERVETGIRRRIHMCRPVGTHDDLLGWYVDGIRAFATSDDIGGSPLSVVIAAHGTNRHRGNADRAQTVVKRVRDLGIAERVEALFIDQEPRIGAWREHVKSRDVLVAPHLMSLGHHGRRDIPEALGIAGRGIHDALARHSIAGPFKSGAHRVWYGPLLGACPLIPDVAVKRVRQWDQPWNESAG